MRIELVFSVCPGELTPNGHNVAVLRRTTETEIRKEFARFTRWPYGTDWTLDYLSGQFGGSAGLTEGCHLLERVTGQHVVMAGYESILA